MEYAIAVFIGVWFTLAGVVAMIFVNKSFLDVSNKKETDEKPDSKN